MDVLIVADYEYSDGSLAKESGEWTKDTFTEKEVIKVAKWFLCRHLSIIDCYGNIKVIKYKNKMLVKE